MVTQIGFQITKDALNNRIGSAVQQVRDALADLVDTQGVVTTMTEQDAAALTSLGFTSDEAAAVNAVLTDFVNASNVLHGQQAQAGASDFFFNARQYGVTGLV